MFKECPMCSKVWESRDAFLKDRSLVLNGYQVDFDNLCNGLLFFTHNVDGCNSTMAVVVKEFYDLNSGVQFEKRLTLSEQCPQYCLRKGMLDRCLVECDCAFVRDVINIIKSYKPED